MIDDTARRLGNRLKNLRKLKYPNDDQATFGVRIGVSRDTIRKMEKGDPSVSLKSYLEAADLMDCLHQVEGVFMEEGENLPPTRSPRSGPSWASLQELPKADADFLQERPVIVSDEDRFNL